MDDEAPMFCHVNGAYCVRAFCEDYGCADEAGCPVTEHDIETGHYVDQTLTLKRRRKPRSDCRQQKLI